MPIIQLSPVVVNALMRGYAGLVSRRHVVELHDLREAEGAAFIRDVRRLSAAVKHATGAVLRYPGDPFEGGPIDPKAVRKPAYAPGELTVVRARLREALTGAA